MAALLGIELAKLLTPTLVAVTGWGFGIIGAIYIRKVKHSAIWYALFTFGVTVGAAVPLSILAAKYVGESAVLWLPLISICIPFVGDKMLAMLAQVIPSKLSSMVGRDKR